MIVIPAEGALVRDPMTKLALTGETDVDVNDPYWARLLADGDVMSKASVAETASRAAADSNLSTRVDALTDASHDANEDDAR